jgi:hypothetical protein
MKRVSLVRYRYLQLAICPIVCIFGIQPISNGSINNERNREKADAVHYSRNVPEMVSKVLLQCLVIGMAKHGIHVKIWRMCLYLLGHICHYVLMRVSVFRVCKLAGQTVTDASTGCSPEQSNFVFRNCGDIRCTACSNMANNEYRFTSRSR